MTTPLPEFPAPDAPERLLLEQCLDFYRAVVLRKVEDLPRDAAVTPTTPTGVSPLGVVKHLVWVERGWFRRTLDGESYPVIWSDEDPDADFRIEPDEDVASVVEQYAAECDRSRAVAAARELDDHGPEPERPQTLRWIYVHMIEETARHAGHLDVLRERVDGTTGD